MLWLRTWQLGVKSLLLHPLRSGLTMLGILIGVWAVIVLTAISQGASDVVQKQIESLGANTIIVRSIKPPAEKMTGRAADYGLRRSDLELIVANVPTITSALPIREIRRQFTNGDKTIDGRLVGCTPDYAEINKLAVRNGRFLADADNLRADTICVLAAGVADRLFPYEEPLGKRIYVPENNDYYRVAGVLRHRNASAAIGGSLDSQDFSGDIYIPIRTMQRRIGDTVVTRRAGQMEMEIMELNQITLQVSDVDQVRPTAAMVESLVLPRHAAMQDVAVVVPLELLEQARNLRMMFLGIGIRRALGAKRKDIVRQFLVETIVLSFSGAALGIVLGFLGPPMYHSLLYLVFKFSPEKFASLPEAIRQAEPSIVYATIPLAVGIAVAVGLVSGLYPAIRAAKMNPIDALRHE